ncbi:unnamed protein product, partial [marine sediment metagenome]
KAVDPVWKKFVRMGTVNRLHPHVGGRRFAIHGGNAVLPIVAEKGEYWLEASRKSSTMSMPTSVVPNSISPGRLCLRTTWAH